jgi:hypothetical protein
MAKVKKSYLLPTKLIGTFDKTCFASGLVREKVVAASICHFMSCDPVARAKMFDALDKFLKRRKR